MEKLKDCVIIVDGHKVGYQFNKKSMGSRTFRHHTVKLEGDTASAYISTLRRDIKVRRCWKDNSRFWEAY